jgi:hypothetical protein
VSAFYTSSIFVHNYSWVNNREGTDLIIKENVFRENYNGNDIDETQIG